MKATDEKSRIWIRNPVYGSKALDSSKNVKDPEHCREGTQKEKLWSEKFWCGFCKNLKNFLVSNERFKEASRNFIFISLCKRLPLKFVAVCVCTENYRKVGYRFNSIDLQKYTVGVVRSVADPGCLSRISDPYFYPSWTPDPKSATKKGVIKICWDTEPFCGHKFHKIKNYFIFEMLKKKIWAKYQRIIELFTQKIVIKLSKIWVWDPGSGSRLQGQKGIGSRIRNTGCTVPWYRVYLVTQAHNENSRMFLLLR